MTLRVWGARGLGSYLLQGLEDTIHVGYLAVVGVEGEVDLDAADAVDRHCGGRSGRWRSGREDAGDGGAAKTEMGGLGPYSTQTPITVRCNIQLSSVISQQYFFSEKAYRVV